VGLKPLVASSATSGNVVAVTVNAPEEADWIHAYPQEHWPSGRGNCDGWEIINNYNLWPDGPPTSQLAIEIGGPGGAPQYIAALPSGDVFFLADDSTDTYRMFGWRAGGGTFQPLELTRDLSECHELAGDYDAYEALFSS